MKSGDFDILGLGSTAVDDLLYVPNYPPVDGKMKIDRSERHCGGLTASALVAASRLGARCGFAGTLGHDELSRLVLDTLTQEGVDLRHVHYDDNARPIHAVGIIDEATHSRTLFYDNRQMLGAAPDWPPESVIQATKVLLVDHYGMAGMLRAATIARAAGIPVVSDVERINVPHVDALYAQINHLIVSLPFARQRTGQMAPEDVVRALSAQHEYVVATSGDEGCWYTEAGASEVQHFNAFAVDVVDTIGCGDVFRGAYAAALVRGEPMAERVRQASATAALKATQTGGQQGCPTREQLAAFLAKQSQTLRET